MLRYEPGQCMCQRKRACAHRKRIRGVKGRFHEIKTRFREIGTLPWYAAIHLACYGMRLVSLRVNTKEFAPIGDEPAAIQADSAKSKHDSVK